MAVIRQRINRKNAAGTYDTIRLETDSSLVLRANGHNLETDALFKLATYYPEGSSVNLDTILDGLMLVHSSEAKNCPVTTGYLYIVQLFYSNVAATSPHIQIAFPYTASSQHAAAFRTYCNGWSSWEKIYTNNAKPTAADIGAAAASHGTHVTYASAVPKALGTAAVGTSAKVAREDHVHPLPTAAQVGAAPASHGTHVTFTTTAPKVAGTGAAGTATTVARSDHVHPAQTTVTGNAGTATKLATARTFRVSLGSTSAVSFDGSANVTPGVTGTLGVGNGGTGVTSIAALKKALGIGSPTVTAPTYPASVPAVGNTMTWAGKTWRVVHKMTGIAVLALEYREKNVQFSALQYVNGYIGSKLFDECMTFANTLKLFAADYLISFGGLPCFVPGADEVNGDFTWFATQANRIYKNSSGTAYTWWTSSPSEFSGGYSFASYVSTDGAINSGSNYVASSYGFRPCVAIRL